MGQIGCQQGLTHTADGSGTEHGLNALNHGVYGHFRLPGDFGKRIGQKALNGVFGNSQNGGVDGIVNPGGHGMSRGARGV